MHSLSSLALILSIASGLTAQCGTSQLATRTDGNTSFGTGGGNFFDVNVINPFGISVCAIDTKTTAPLGTPITVNIYSTPGTYVGVAQTMAAWRLIATGTGTGNGTLMPPVPVTLAQPFYLAAGSHGLFVQIATGGGPQYTQGTNTYSNNDLTLTLGASQGTAFTSALATPRTWNGVLHYSTCMNGGDAGYGFFAAGCAGTLPVTTQHHQSRPVLGQTLTVNLDNLPLGVAVMVIGLSNTTSGFGPLPFDLGLLGAPGCMAHVSLDATVFLAGTGNSATWNLGIPNNPALQCRQFYTQPLVVDPTVNALGLVAGDASAGVIGT